MYLNIKQNVALALMILHILTFTSLSWVLLYWEGFCAMNVECQIRTKVAEAAGLDGAGFRGFHPKNINRGMSYPAGAPRTLLDPWQDGTATLTPCSQDAAKKQGQKENSCEKVKFNKEELKTK